MHEHSKFLLVDSQIPTIWVNVLPSLPEPLAPPLNPQTRAPLTPEDLAPIFPMELIQQEFSPQPEIDIPGEVMDIYRLWRATPLYRARRLEKALDTPAQSITSTRAPAPRAATNPTPRCRRRITTSAPASRGCPPRRAPDSGVARCLSLANSSGWNARSTWCGSATIRNHTAAC